MNGKPDPHALKHATGLLVIALDRDTAGHLAIALRRHRGQLQKLGYAEPQGLAELETLAQSVTKSHQQSPGVSVLTVPDDDSSDNRDFLTRNDISRRTGTSLSTVDRWIRIGALPSVKRGRTRRVSRADLNQFLAA